MVLTTTTSLYVLASTTISSVYYVSSCFTGALNVVVYHLLTTEPPAYTKRINPFPVITIPRMKQLLFSIYHQPANNCFSLTAPTHGTISVGTKNTLKQRGAYRLVVSTRDLGHNEKLI